MSFLIVVGFLVIIDVCVFGDDGVDVWFGFFGLIGNNYVDIFMLFMVWSED